MFRWISRLFQSPRAEPERQQGDVHALDTAGDPRGGVQDETYRHAEPTEVVEAEGVAMGGPGGAVPGDAGPDERRARDRS